MTRIDLWDQWFPGVPPLAHLLKERFPDRWVRFHSLPNSQRYPKNDAEMLVVLSRFRSVLNEVSTQSTRCILLTMDWAYGMETDDFAFPYTPDTRGIVWRVVEQEEVWPWTIFQHECAPFSNEFDHLVKRAAQDEIANLMIVDWDGRWIVHPYDGGTDVILRDTTERDRLINLFPEWLSPYFRGL